MFIFRLRSASLHLNLRIFSGGSIWYTYERFIPCPRHSCGTPIFLRYRQINHAIEGAAGVVLRSQPPASRARHDWCELDECQVLTPAKIRTLSSVRRHGVHKQPRYALKLRSNHKKLHGKERVERGTTHPLVVIVI